MTTTATEGQMPWIKFNPEEWLGYCDGMTDEELGLFHRVLAKLWKTPSLSMPLDTLRLQLRIRAGDPRDQLLTGLIGLGLVADGDRITIPPLTAAFEDAVKRSRIASRGGQARRDRQTKTANEEPLLAPRPLPPGDDDDAIDF